MCVWCRQGIPIRSKCMQEHRRTLSSTIATFRTCAKRGTSPDVTLFPVRLALTKQCLFPILWEMKWLRRFHCCVTRPLPLWVNFCDIVVRDDQRDLLDTAFADSIESDVALICALWFSMDAEQSREWLLQHDRGSSSFQSIVGSLMWWVGVCVVVTNTATSIKAEESFERLHIVTDERSDPLCYMLRSRGNKRRWMQVSRKKCLQNPVLFFWLTRWVHPAIKPRLNLNGVCFKCSLVFSRNRSDARTTTNLTTVHNMPATSGTTNILKVECNSNIKLWCFLGIAI